MTKTTAKTGINMDTTDIIRDVPVSIDDTMGFAIPPVVAVEANRVVLDVPATAAAVPPPAIIAKAQVITGLKSATVDNNSKIHNLLIFKFSQGLKSGRNA